MNAKIELGDIHVTRIDTSSGIFISKINFANGWRSQTKSNSGFGEIGDQNKIENCIFVVSDDDIIDSPMEDNSVLVENNLVHSESETAIHFNEIKVDSLNQNATISIGENQQTGWSSPSKENEGNGDFFGDSQFSNNQIFLKDDDLVDAPIFDNHITSNRLG